jgi:hypothetical protein
MQNLVVIRAHNTGFRMDRTFYGPYDLRKAFTVAAELRNANPDDLVTTQYLKA